MQFSILLALVGFASAATYYTSTPSYSNSYRSCSSSYECSSGQICSNGQCMSSLGYNGGLYSNTYNNNQFDMNSQYGNQMSNTGSGLYCTTSYSCRSGETCMNNRCQNSYSNNNMYGNQYSSNYGSTTCRYSTDCMSGQTCSNGMCTAQYGTSYNNPMYSSSTG
ncbi:hypothetical protein CAEBREN_17342, partial [Caenorhabditis brenneri]